MARKSRKNVGLIGLGIIGSRVAAGLRAAGSHVFVWNRTPKPVPNFVGSPAEVAEICDVIQLFVADAQAVADVVEIMAPLLEKRHIVINCSTIGAEASVAIAKLVQERGAAFLDAPFTGSKIAAEKSQLVYYVGGDEDVFQRARPVLEATSRAIVRCGRVGDAATLKIATNLLTAVTTQTLAEALALVRAVGISPQTFAAALEHNACKSGVVELKLPKMINGDYEPHFSVKHMFKDVQLGIHAANEQRLEVPLTTVVGGILYGALCNGWGDLDFASLYRNYTDAPAADAPIALVDATPKPSANEPPEEAPPEAIAAEPEPAMEAPGDAEAAPEPPTDSEPESAQPSPAPPEQAPASEAASVAHNGASEDDEEDPGLAGFFSRVFRRKGTPVEK
ncbi:MAG: NAD(P)-dependent oxidoreductase [Chthoniobacteraceae bacterium]